MVLTPPGTMRCSPICLKAPGWGVWVVPSNWGQASRHGTALGSLGTPAEGLVAGWLGCWQWRGWLHWPSTLPMPGLALCLALWTPDRVSGPNSWGLYHCSGTRVLEQLAPRAHAPQQDSLYEPVFCVHVGVEGLVIIHDLAPSDQQPVTLPGAEPVSAALPPVTETQLSAQTCNPTPTWQRVLPLGTPHGPHSHVLATEQPGLRTTSTATLPPGKGSLVAHSHCRQGGLALTDGHQLAHTHVAAASQRTTCS